MFNIHSTYEVAVIQANFKNRDIQDNVDKIKSLVKETKRNSPEVKLILFPELCVTGYFLTEDIRQVAEEAEGDTYRTISTLAREYQVYIGYGFVEKGKDQHIYNSVSLINQEGQRVATYQKIHLTPLEREIFTPGQHLVTVETEIGHIGLMICWDLAFPELARLLALKGANMVLVPSAWETPYEQAYQSFAMARAMDNTVFLVTCNHVGESADLCFRGYSGIYKPDGSILQRATSEQEEITYTKIDFTQQRELQQSFYTMLEERRTDIYHLAWKEDNH